MDVMKLVFGVLFIGIVILAASPSGEAAIYSVFDNLTNLSTCGLQPPNSVLGYGAASSWPFIFTCDNIADGICPEDYQDATNASVFASCASCMDPDCSGILRGYVFDERGFPHPIDRALVKSNPIKWNASAPDLGNSTYTAIDGYYDIGVLTGKYYFTAGKEAFDTEVKEAIITRNNITYLNFSLLNGTCHDDCTNSYGRCSANCNGTRFNQNSTSCEFHDSKVMSLCDLRMKGTGVLYNITDSDTAYFVDCCEGVPYEVYYSQAAVDSRGINDLIKMEKIARYNDAPVRVIVAYWTPVNR
jgi:hypothetical protein